MDEAEPCALKRNVSLDAAAVFAIAPERVAAGRELHPYLVGVQSNTLFTECLYASSSTTNTILKQNP